MLPIYARANPPEERTLGEEEHHQTSIRVQQDSTNPREIHLDKITQQAYAHNNRNYSARLTKERYTPARSSLPVGNFDWTEHKPKGTVRREKERKEWTCKQRLILGILILLLSAAVTGLVIYLLSPADRGLHEKSVEPQVPTFFEMSGRMNAPKLQPLVQVDEGAPNRHTLRAE